VEKIYKERESEKKASLHFTANLHTDGKEEQLPGVNKDPEPPDIDIVFEGVQPLGQAE
jgi:hypothetical protein